MAWHSGVTFHPAGAHHRTYTHRPAPGMDTVVASLRSGGAYGRATVLWNLLGLHFNIDPPRLNAATVTASLKAFLLVNDRLRMKTVRGRFRRALALSPDYPQAYKKRVLNPDYWPDRPKLTGDYLAAKPTGNGHWTSFHFWLTSMRSGCAQFCRMRRSDPDRCFNTVCLRRT
jgi:hypothetical protein